MVSFSDFMAENESSDGTYASVTYNSATQQRLRKIQKELEVPNPLNRNKFHTTLLYSRKKVDDVESRDLRYVSKVSELVLDEWEQRDGTTCLVAKFDCDFLSKRHEHYRSLGGTHDFDSYQPHITLSYDLEDKVGDFKGTTIKLESPLLYAREIVEPLNLDWKETLE